MSEAFRQQIAATGLQDVKAVLSTTTADLKQVARDLDATVKPIAGRYGTLADQIEKQASGIDYQSGKLVRAAEALERKNSQLLNEVTSLSWYWHVAVALVLLLLGVFGGVTWEHGQVSDSLTALQNRSGNCSRTLRPRRKRLFPPQRQGRRGRGIQTSAGSCQALFCRNFRGRKEHFICYSPLSKKRWRVYPKPVRSTVCRPCD